MSRIGKKPITIPSQVKVLKKGDQIEVSGPKGTLTQTIHPKIRVALKDGQILVSRQGNDKLARSLHGLTRTLIANMITGVTEGYQKTLELHGTGYRASKEGNRIKLTLGFSHPVYVEPVEGITIDVPDQKTIVVSGIDKQLVGQVAAQIRALKKPEPYKGKGIRYKGEVIRRKPGKAGKVGAAGGAAAG